MVHLYTPMIFPREMIPIGREICNMEGFEGSCAEQQYLIGGFVKCDEEVAVELKRMKELP